jgi:hypothetical protein
VNAPGGTVALTEVDETTVKLTAAAPPNVTAVAPERLVPLIVTTVPTGPDVGEKPLTAGLTVKEVALAAVPPGVVTATAPLAALLGTVALM